VNQESVAQGMANVGAGVFQGMPVSTSLSASSLNESSGARTPMASLTTGALVIATLLVLAPLFSDLPKAVLAAIIVDAVVFGMIDVGELRRLYRVTRFDFWIAVAAIIGVLSAGVIVGVVIGVVLSLGWLIYVATRPPMPLLGRQAGTQVFRDLDENPGDETYPGVAVLRLDGGLFFATAEALEDRIRGVIDAEPPVRALVLDCEGVNFIDFPGRGEARRDRRSHQRRRGRPAPRRGQVVRPGGARGERDRRVDRRGPPARQRPSRGGSRTGRGRRRLRRPAAGRGVIPGVDSRRGGASSVPAARQAVAVRRAPR
jgi:sulfate permease, SulP family